MSRLFICALMALMASVAGGCMTPLDRAWADVNTKKRAADSAFAAVARVYSSAADDMADKKHDLQRRHVDRDWADFKRIHTDNGRLVSRDALGNVVPLRVEDLDAAVEARDAKVAAVMASKASWRAVHEPFGEAIARFEAASISTGETEAEILRAKQSAQSYADAVLGAVAGIGAGMAAGAAVAP